VETIYISSVEYVLTKPQKAMLASSRVMKVANSGDFLLKLEMIGFNLSSM
jgi:hypothetical protein